MPRSSKTPRTPGAAPRVPVLDLDSHIATKVAIFANRLSRAASRFYRKSFGIGVVEWRLMICIGHAKETRANRIWAFSADGARGARGRRGRARVRRRWKWGRFLLG